MTPFKQKVIEIVKKIPNGKVMSYGQVALYADFPQGARQVGGILKEEAQSVPWWRVINKEGLISIKGNWNADKNLQKKLLEAEGIVVNDFQVDMDKYCFRLKI